MEKIYREGAVGALIDEYERAVLEYQKLIREMPESDFVRVCDPATEDEECRSIETITAHVVRAGYSYANYIRERFSLDAESLPQGKFSPPEAVAKLAGMLEYTAQALDGRWRMTDDEIMQTIFRTRWGVTYDLEQLLEHAVVHVLRHRRQIERFLAKSAS